ncbi:hypothetical protein Y032_0003g1364 [Ancylostoma ceylanicum]|uniref:Integrase catalytic domain-containing protein n=1 Tax=Ancylostoma ceylanicum TaxID=53326 RepID=A0A016VXD4_9BILA|nr:hypothetical protein Y032_0003g1364 [Ancylostoma ceylanicum]
MGKALEDVNMVESSDEDEEVTHVDPVSQTEKLFPDSNIVAELREILEMLREIPEAIGREIADHKISARYKEKHFETLRKEIEVVSCKVEQLEMKCQLTRITKIEHITTKGYNPRENGLTERLNGTIVAMLRRTTVIPMEWDVRLPFCLMAYNMTPHRSTGESPYFVLHGKDPNFPSAIIPNGGVSWYAMDENLEDYKAQLLQSVAESHERIREYNERVREKMKREYDRRNDVDVGKHAKVGDRVYVFSPNEKALNSHPKFACEWAGPFRVLETSQNSALVSRIGEDSEPVRIQFDMLRVVPPFISDDPVDTRTARGRRGRKPVKNKVCSLTVPFFSGATLLSPPEKGHLLFKCSDGCLEDATLKDVGGCKFPGAVAREQITTLWSAWLATSIFRRTDISVGEKIRMHREGAVCYDAESPKEVLKMAYQKCIDWTDFIANTKKIVKHAPVEGHYFDSSYDEALRMVRNELDDEAARNRPQKTGPVGFIAGEGALALERDGQRGDILVKMATTFDRVLEVLEEWSTFRSWVIVWPIDSRMNEERSKKLLKLAKTHLESGGKIVTVWPPVNEKNEMKWRAVAELWNTLDDALLKIDVGNNVFTTSSVKIIEGKIFIEAGSPEGSGQFFTSHVSAGVPKYVYEAARKKAVGALLPKLPDSRYLTSRAMSSPGEGMLGKGGQTGLPAKRRAM